MMIMKKKMIETVKCTGLHSEETIKCSQNLDIIINQKRSIQQIKIYVFY